MRGLSSGHWWEADATDAAIVITDQYSQLRLAGLPMASSPSPTAARYTGAMFVKRVTRYNKDGSKVTYYQLAHNVWDAEKKVSRTKVLAPLGRSDNLDRDAIHRLIESLTKLLEETAPTPTYGRHARRAKESSPTAPATAGMPATGAGPRHGRPPAAPPSHRG